MYIPLRVTVIAPSSTGAIHFINKVCSMKRPRYPHSVVVFLKQIVNVLWSGVNTSSGFRTLKGERREERIRECT